MRDGRPTQSDSPTDADTGSWRVRDLRRRWKPHKQALQYEPAAEPLLIRVHRCCSWLHRVEQLEDPNALETQLIYRWIALNSLYGQWDAERREPAGDRQTMTAFLERIIALDHDGRVGAVLTRHRRLVMSIFEDAYLTRYYWQDPANHGAKRSRKTVFNARTWYHEQRFNRLLFEVVDRIYLLRCQLVHGAATHGGQLNRTALRRCATMLGHLMPAFVLVVIDHGRAEDWGALCYPPQQTDRRV